MSRALVAGVAVSSRARVERARARLASLPVLAPSQTRQRVSASAAVHTLYVLTYLARRLTQSVVYRYTYLFSHRRRPGRGLTQSVVYRSSRIRSNRL
jgi:hypothetical protein